jgi:hypothetical protein
MKVYKQIILFSIIGLIMISCATGPTYTEMAGQTPPVSSENGRVYVYRTTTLGAALQPEVELDGQSVGKAVPLGYFYIDCPPGNHTIAISTEVDRELTFNLDKGQVRYVRLNVSMGFFVGHVYPDLIEKQEAEEEIESCHFIGVHPPQ